MTYYNTITKDLRANHDVNIYEIASWYPNTNKLQVEEFEAEPKP